MKDYDAKDVYIEVDGKQYFGFSDDSFYLPKDNSKENREALLQDFKRRLSRPLDEAAFYNVSYKQIPERDY